MHRYKTYALPATDGRCSHQRPQKFDVRYVSVVVLTWSISSSTKLTVEMFKEIQRKNIQATSGIVWWRRSDRKELWELVCAENNANICLELNSRMYKVIAISCKKTWKKKQIHHKCLDSLCACFLNENGLNPQLASGFRGHATNI